MDKYPITYGGHSCIQMQSDSYYLSTGNGGNWGAAELDGKWCTVTPGQTVTISAYFWTEAATTSETLQFSGGILGADMYCNSGRVVQINNHNGAGVPAYSNGNYDYYMQAVPFGSGGWVKLTMSWTIQSTYQADGWGGAGNFPAGTTLVPTAFIPWVSLDSSNPSSEHAKMYVYGTELYINS